MATLWMTVALAPFAWAPLAWTWSPIFTVGVALWVALTAVVLLIYCFGERPRSTVLGPQNIQRQRELERAAVIAHDLDSITDTLRQDLDSQHGRFAEFRRLLVEAEASNDEQTWKQLCSEAEKILPSTMQLAEQLSMAYEAIRQQSEALETFTQSRIDPLTGVGNSRALDEKLDVLVGAKRRGGAEFSLALVSVDRDSSRGGEQVRTGQTAQLSELARLIRACMRDSDFVARTVTTSLSWSCRKQSSPGPVHSASDCVRRSPRGWRLRSAAA